MKWWKRKIEKITSKADKRRRNFLFIYLLFSLDDIAICTAIIVLGSLFFSLPWWAGLLLTLLTLLKLLIFYPHARKAYLKKPHTGSQALIGKRGEVIEDLNPKGKIKIQGSLWIARSVGGNLKRGQIVEIVRTKNLTMLVKKAKEP